MYQPAISVEVRKYTSRMGERVDRFKENAAKPGFLNSGHDLRAFWSGVSHENDPEHPEDKDWAASEPDPNSP